MAVSICVLAFSLCKIGHKLYGYYHDNKQYEEIKAQMKPVDHSEIFGEIFESIPSSPSVTQISEGVSESLQVEKLCTYKVKNGDPSEIDDNDNLKEYSEMKKKNPDLVGWVKMPGFKKAIDYPVMQGKDNEFYLSKDFYGNYSYAGSIFMDILNNPLMVDKHLILYGHAMNDTSMFGNLKEYPGQPEKYMSNTVIYLDLMNTRLEYEVFSTYWEKASFNYRQTQFTSDDEYISFLNSIHSKSVYDYPVELTSRDKILTLSTCNKRLGSDMRSIVHARLLRQIVYEKDNIEENIGDKDKGNQKKIISANVYLELLSLWYRLDIQNQQQVQEDQVLSESQVIQKMPDTQESQNAKRTELYEIPLNPTFDNRFKEFSAEIPPDIESIILNYATADPKARVQITLDDKNTDDTTFLLHGVENTIKLKVISQDGLYSRIYTIKVTKPEQPKLETQVE